MHTINEDLTFLDLSDDSETQDPALLREQDASETILKELGELKELVKDVQKRQGTMEKTIRSLVSKLSNQEFDLAKSSHAVSISFSKKIKQ